MGGHQEWGTAVAKHDSRGSLGLRNSIWGKSFLKSKWLILGHVKNKACPLNTLITHVDNSENFTDTIIFPTSYMEAGVSQTFKKEMW